MKMITMSGTMERMIVNAILITILTFLFYIICLYFQNVESKDEGGVENQKS